MLFYFFRYLIYSVFHQTFVKMFMKKPSFFRSNFKNPFQDVVCYRKLRCLILRYWKWRPFEYKIKSWKLCPFLGLLFSGIKNADILNFSWIKYFGNYFSFLIKWHIWVYYCWNYGPSNLKAELKADFWLQIGIYSWKNCPRYGSGQLPPANS